MKLTFDRLWPLAIIPVTVAADQYSKHLVLADARYNALECLEFSSRCGQVVLPGPIDFTMLWNRGMSYGLLQSEGIMRWVLAGVMFVIAMGFLVWLTRADGARLKLALSLVIGGAFGNLIDRVRFGAVVDFIDASALYFPWVFNVADTAVSVGAVLLFIDQFLFSPQKRAKTEAS